MATAKQATQAPQEEEYVNSVLDEEASVAPRRYFTIPGRDPFDEIEWETRDALIPGKNGPAFEQRDVEFPKFWSQTATNIVAQKYFRGRMASPERERSVKQMIGRVADTITGWGIQGGYFATDEEAETFQAELKAILVNQVASFNSPGLVQRRLRGGAAVLGVLHPLDRRLDGVDPRLDPARGDHLPRRLGLGPQPLAAPLVEGAALEGRLRLGPGLVHARRGRVGRDDQVGRQDAPRGEDGRARRRPPRRRRVHLVQGARRSARRASSSRRATTCRSTRPTGPRSSTRTRTTRSASRTPSWRRSRRARSGRSPRAPTARSSRRSRRGSSCKDIAAAAWECADPGVQYDTTINAWHTSPNTGRINASNPCSEYMHIDDSACNLASLNLMKFRREDGEFDVEMFEHAVDVVFLAQEIAVGYSSYPTPEIGRNAKRFRQLGLGYANLGALLMARGLPYDSDEGRAYAAAITALMTGRAYRKSAEAAQRMSAHDGLPGEPRRDGRRDREAPRRGREHRPHRVGARRPARGRAARVGRGARDRRGARLPQRAGDRARADRDDQLHDGLRHDGGRAGLLARQVEEARRRRRDHDRQQDGADGARRARLRAARGRGDRRVHRRARRRRRRPAPEDRALPRVRLRDRRACDPLHGAREDDGRGAAVHLGRDLEDGQPARGDDGRRGRPALRRVVAARRQGDRDLPRQLQGGPAALVLEGRGSAGARRRSSPAALRPRIRSAAGCRTTAPRSAASSRSASTRATSTSASSRTGRPATSSWTSRRRARRSPA